MTHDPRLVPHRLPALVFAVFLLVIAGSAAVLFAVKLGPGPRAVAAYYRGDEARFVPPRSFDGLLLVAVPHLTAIPLVLFAAAHVVGFARALGQGAFRALVWLSFGSAFASVASGFLVRFVTPGAAWLAIGAFAGLEVAVLAWAALLVAVFLPVRAARSREERPGGLLDGAPGRAAPRA